MNKPENASFDLIPYLMAKKILKKEFPDTTPEEIAMWVFLEPLENNGTNLDNDPNNLEDYVIHGMEQGGIKSYFNNDTERRKVLDIYNRATVGETIGWNEVLRNMCLRLFSRSEINSFVPPDRWISYDKLFARWSKRCDKKEAEAIIDNKLDKDAPGILRELTMSYPVSVMDQTKEVCMYSINEIEIIENKEFLSELTDVEELGTETTGHFVTPSVTHASSEPVTTITRGGRPREINKKVCMLRQIITHMTAVKMIQLNVLPGSSADLLDACQRIEKAKTGRIKVFKTTEGTFKKWLIAAGYRFKPGRTLKDEEKFWTKLCVDTMVNIPPDVFI
jgi:hypothetical protein